MEGGFLMEFIERVWGVVVEVGKRVLKRKD